MDIVAARTFLEIVKTGSFIRAAANLNITQTAVSARVRVLEEQLDRQLFIRNKAGARLTSAGDQFLRYATTLVQVWERARHDVAMPIGRENVVTVGGEHSLWNPLLLDWLVWMRSECSDVAIRADIDIPERLIDQVQEGIVDLAVMYAPPPRTGVVAELLLEEALVAVSTKTEPDDKWWEDYVFVDWGPEFRSNHHAAFPDAPSPVVSINHGPLALDYILQVGGSGYFRMQAARPHLESGRLQLVDDKPRFSYSIYALYSAKADERLMQRVRTGLRAVATAPHQSGG
jgi:LysR family transcriptional regulator, flagellar master operon regulator